MSSPTDPMRIMFDAYWWVSGPPSGRNVLVSLVVAWSRRHPHDRLTLLVRPHEAHRVDEDLNRRGIRADLRAVGPLSRIHALAARGAGRSAGDQDAIITQNFAARTHGAVSAVLVHDAMYVDHPEWFSFAERVYLAWLRPTLRSADVIFSTSRSETARIGRVWPETRARLRRVGLDVPVDLVGLEPRRPPMVEDDRPYLLAVGRINVRKNVSRLVEAFHGDEALAGRYRLLIVGSPDGLSERLSTGSGDAVRFLSDVDDAGLRWLYEHATLFVLPSLDEGFGLPLLEARSAGTPSIASDLPVFREIGADAYFDPRSTADLRRALHDGIAVGRGRAMDSGEWSEVVDRMRDGLLSIGTRRTQHAPAA